MRRIALRILVPLTCVAMMSCGSDPTSPDPPGAGGGGGGRGGGGGPTGETAIASDSVFEDSDWDAEVQVFGAGGRGNAGHLHYQGQASGDYRRISITVNDATGGTPAQVAVFSIKRGATYFPSSDGAIFSVDYSEDSIHFEGAGSGQFSAPAFRQNGKLYTLVPGGLAFATPDLAWTHHSLTGLRQNDFRTLASATDHPDFSASGSRIEVGFMRMVSVPPGSPGGTWSGGIDNWRITLNR